MRLNENHPLQFTFLLDDEPACALVCCCESCVILLRELCGIFRCLHRIARADRGQERQKQREKQRKEPYVTEREGKVDSEMEISGVISYGIAPVISVKTFLPETSVMAGTDMEEEDLYTRQKLLQRQLESVDIQEEYIKDEQKNLKRELLRAHEEVKRIQSVPLVIGQFIEMMDQNNGIVASETVSSVALHRHSNALVDILPPEADSSISLLSQSDKPDVTYSDIGGYDIQKQEIREAVELPLTHHELYKQIGVLWYGPPETGKTMLAKAVAHHTTAAFICVVGSEFVQKYLGEGPRMVWDVFQLAKENAPAIIFIDEIDAIATAGFDAQTGADREVQHILMELLNQMDGLIRQSM
ncbi:hypothetical protein CY35_18G044900 [Sphagnum magellanicum]|nr:hypothetical protein CY35_18G044900 [Sphagnum magellanicum]